MSHSYKRHITVEKREITKERAVLKEKVNAPHAAGRGGSAYPCCCGATQCRDVSHA